MSTALNQQCWCSSEAQGLELMQVWVWPLRPLLMLLLCVTMLSCGRCSECWCRGSLDTLCTLSQWHCWRPLYWALRGDGVRRGYMNCPTRYFELMWIPHFQHILSISPVYCIHTVCSIIDILYSWSNIENWIWWIMWKMIILYQTFKFIRIIF